LDLARGAWLIATLARLSAMQVPRASSPSLARWANDLSLAHSFIDHNLANCLTGSQSVKTDIDILERQAVSN
jgi:hypothetical protein